ncbi:MAG: FliO/MopB family protein [Acidobacteriota bacterium]|nr:FliO/MopB family protein [Acidobacteriota bacterium]
MDTLQPILAVILVLALLGGSLLLLRKRGAAAFHLPKLGGAQRRLEMIERLPLGPQHAVHLVKVDGRTLVIATAPGGCSVLKAESEAAGA